MLIVTVKPKKPSALNIKHPNGPQMIEAGVLWPNDSFTARRVRDGAVEIVETPVPAAEPPVA